MVPWRIRARRSRAADTGRVGRAAWRAKGGRGRRGATLDMCPWRRGGMVGPIGCLNAIGGDTTDGRSAPCSARLLAPGGCGGRSGACTPQTPRDCRHHLGGVVWIVAWHPASGLCNWVTLTDAGIHMEHPQFRPRAPRLGPRLGSCKRVMSLTTGQARVGPVDLVAATAS